MKVDRVFGAIIFCVLFALSIGARAERPRLGLEVELAPYNDAGQILNPNHLPDREKRIESVLSFWRKRMPNVGFRVDKEWVSEGSHADGLELVSPPLSPEQVELFAEHFDQFLRNVAVGPGLRGSLQFNIELRDLIPGFSLQERPTQKMGLPFQDIQNANVSEVVRLLLFLEDNYLPILVAQAPQRMGRLMSYFALPLSLEHTELLNKLRELPPEKQTYKAVRDLFLAFGEQEKQFTKYGKRTPWKYRSFNIDKFFKLREQNPEWVYPAIEIRAPDAPMSREDFLIQSEFVYSLVKASLHYDGKSSAPPAELTEFFARYRQKMEFGSLVQLLNQHLVNWSGSPEGKKVYRDFLGRLDLSGLPKPLRQSLFVRGSGYASQVYQALQPLFNGTPSPQPAAATFGAEFEFEGDSFDRNLQQIAFLESSITRESSGNREVRTVPTADKSELLDQINDVRSVLTENLRSIHVHVRVPKSTVNVDEDFYAWLGDISDWIVALRVMYRRSSFAFNARTQQRFKQTDPNAWIGHDKREYRGTVRAFEVGDHLDIELRGLMTGIFDLPSLPSKDYLNVALDILLTGLAQPELIPKTAVYRLASEHSLASVVFAQEVRAHAARRGWKEEHLVHSPEKLLSTLIDPERMLLPLQGFEFNPRLTVQDVQKFKNAKLYWLDEVVNLVANSESLEDAKAAFLKSLQNWAVRVDLATIMLQTLLVKPLADDNWEVQNLPAHSVRLQWLRKLLLLQNGAYARLEFADHLAKWFRHARSAFKIEVEPLTEGEKSLLFGILKDQLAPIELADLRKILGVSVPEKAIMKDSSLRTNLQILMDSERKSAVGAHPRTPSPQTPPPMEKTQPSRSKTEAYNDIIGLTDRHPPQWAEKAHEILKTVHHGDDRIETLTMISHWGAESCATCIFTHRGEIWDKISTLYSKMNLSRKDLARAARPWIPLLEKHSRKEYHKGSSYSSYSRLHAAEVLREFDRILTREEVRHHSALSYYYSFFGVNLPPSESECENALRGP